MRIKLNLTLPDGTLRPTVITTDATATVGEVARAVQAGLSNLPVPADESLSLQRVAPDGRPLRVLPSRSLLVETNLRSGQSVRVVRWSDSELSAGSVAAARLRVIAGPNAGESFELRLGPNIVGRDSECDVVLDDHLVSRRHARIVVTEKVDIVDMNSSNGVIIDDERVDSAVIGPRDTVILGNSTVLVEPNPDRVTGTEELQELEFNRSPLVRPIYEGKTFQAPKPPSRPKANKFPWVALFGPVMMGVILFLVVRSPYAIMFMIMGPMMALGNYWDRKSTEGKNTKIDRERFRDDIDALRKDITAALDEEQVARSAEVPSLDELMKAAFGLNPDLWHRRPADANALMLNLGFGRAPSRHTFQSSERGDAEAEPWAEIENLRDQATYVNNVPLPASLRQIGNLGLAGSREWLDGVASGIIAQLVTLHSPAELTLAAIASAESATRWNWLMWLPHVDSSHSPLDGVHLASSPSVVTSLVTTLEELVAARTEIGAKVRFSDVVLLVENDAPVERGRLVTLAKNGPAVGVHLVWVAEEHDQLPAACRGYLVRDHAGRMTAGFVDEGQAMPVSRVEPLSPALADQLARQLSPVLDASAPSVDESDIPRSVSYLALAGMDLATNPQVTIGRWRENHSLPGAAASKQAASLSALIGQGGHGEFALDLRAQGPHALVGGTTGAGKSEFLQSWVLGMATAHSPKRVTFLFVDYKGGAAFADCVQLPHTVGLVTDLSPHLVRRALTSLRAELKYRERLLNLKKAKDLVSLERTGDPDCPPSLIIVVDEFAALAKEVPEFVDGVVDVAQRGRSLGLHLILATQRPAGVITSNLRANTNLRIALRMADETDSVDVIDSKLASEFDPRVPGRGAVRTGPGRIALFQSGYAGGRTSDEPEPTRIEIETMTFGPGVPWEIPSIERAHHVDESGPTDIARIVDTVNSAFEICEIAEPRQPWLPELEPTYDLASIVDAVSGGQDGRTLLPLGVVDDPDNQAQHPAYFEPDESGNMAVFGTGGSGRSAVLRTIAVGASMLPSKTHIYGLDFGSSGLTMLESLPTVGAIIDGADRERVVRLIARLTAMLDERSERYSKARVGSISDYREATGDTSDARILILVDGMGAFRENFESSLTLMATYSRFSRLLTEGRAVGIHVILSAERAAALPSALGASVGRRLVLRQADETAYLALGIPRDVLTPESPAGRGVFSGEENELQIAVPGGSTIPAEQARHIDELASHLRAQGVEPAPAVQKLATLVSAHEVPDQVAGLPVLGISEADLAPLGFSPVGAFVVAGMPGSGRTTTLQWLSESLRRWDPSIPQIYFGPRRSLVHKSTVWSHRALDVDEMRALAAELKPAAETQAENPERPGLILVIEALSEIIGTPAEQPVAELVKLARRNGHFIIGENETSNWGASWPLISEIRNTRRGIVMRPDPSDGEILFKVALPRVKRSDYPAGRGVYAAGGQVVTIQVPLLK